MKIILKLNLPLLSAFVIFLGCACATTPPETTASLSGHQTFAVAPLPAQGPASDPGAASRLNNTVREAIVETLSGKGYKEVDLSAADFIVKLHTEFSPDGLIESSEERILRIEFLDKRSNALLWSKQRGRSSSRTLEPALARKSIVEMLSSVPPSSGSLSK